MMYNDIIRLLACHSDGETSATHVASCNIIIIIIINIIILLIIIQGVSRK